MNLDTDRPIDTDGPRSLATPFGRQDYPRTRDGCRASPDMGGLERRFLDTLVGERPLLEYPTHAADKDDGKTVEVCEIPPDRLLEEMRALCPQLRLGQLKPEPDTLLFDLHEGRGFRLGEAMVVREDGRDYAVSPYYLHSGGTCLDWLPAEQVDWWPDTDEDDCEDENEEDDDERKE